MEAKKGLNIFKMLNDAKTASEDFRMLPQSITDRIVKAVYETGFDNRIKLAKMAYKETGVGKWEDKVIKNIIATRFVYNDIKNQKTVGVISENEETGITEIAQPIGPIFATTPITNPTSTALFKILIALKSRNPIIISPHGAAKKSTIEAAKICYEAALGAGAPEYCIQWINRATKDEILEIMSHKNIALILATGSVGLVKTAFSSGNPAIGVGPGNVPVYLGKSSNVDFAVEQIVFSKTFDYGTVCASEQAVVVPDIHVAKVIKEFKKHKAYFMSKAEIAKLEPIAFNKSARVMQVGVIGQSAHTIAKMAGFEVPEDTSILIAPLEIVGMDSPLSFEILAPILAFYHVDNFAHGISLCKDINSHGGLGHTVSIFSRDEDKIHYFANVMNAGRIIVNTPSSQGALGGMYNMLSPSLTLACGSGGKNITTDNITVKHLLNIQRIARRREDPCLSCMHLHSLDMEISADEMEEICFRFKDHKPGEHCGHYK
ncbi:MAG: aldehyde dehydrogenase family protein [Bacteroidota bacterium]|nr:aldehyde dehydrogenase family protein [Bacteroidota bacterium]